ncbi:hypothetical protein GOP47_0027906, partial [Adiantum capillus-veneris]
APLCSGAHCGGHGGVRLGRRGRDRLGERLWVGEDEGLLQRPAYGDRRQAYVAYVGLHDVHPYPYPYLLQGGRPCEDLRRGRRRPYEGRLCHDDGDGRLHDGR